MCFIILTFLSFFIAGPILAAFNATNFIIPAHGGTRAVCGGAVAASNGGASAASNGWAAAPYRVGSGDACGGLLTAGLHATGLLLLATGLWLPATGLLLLVAGLRLLSAG